MNRIGAHANPKLCKKWTQYGIAFISITLKCERTQHVAIVKMAL